MLRGSADVTAKSVALSPVSSPASSVVGQFDAIVRRIVPPADRPPPKNSTGIPTGDGLPSGGAVEPQETQSSAP